MFIVMNRLICPRQYGDNLERAFRQAGNLQDVPGFVSFQFMRRTRDIQVGPLAELGVECEYVAQTQWTSADAYAAWTKTEAYTRARRVAGTSPVTATVDTYEALE
jgi:heme-degrading monooxygenase HmoA